MKKNIFLLTGILLLFLGAIAQQKPNAVQGDIWFGEVNPAHVERLKKEKIYGEYDAEQVAKAKKLSVKYPKLKPYKFLPDTALVILSSGSHDTHGLSFNLRDKNFRLQFALENIDNILLEKEKKIDSKVNIKDFGEEPNIKLSLAPFQPEMGYGDISTLLSNTQKEYGPEYTLDPDNYHLRFTKFTKTHVEGVLDLFMGSDPYGNQPTGGIRNLKFSIPVTNKQITSINGEDAKNMQNDMMKNLEEMQKMLKKTKELISMKSLKLFFCLLPFFGAISFTKAQSSFLFLKPGNQWVYSFVQGAGKAEMTYKVLAHDKKGYFKIEQKIDKEIISDDTYWHADANSFSFITNWPDDETKLVFCTMSSKPGDSWKISIPEDEDNGGISSTKILSLTEKVMVPAGIFSNCIKVRETNSSDPKYYMDYFIDKKVGIVKMEGMGFMVSSLSMKKEYIPVKYELKSKNF